MDGPDSATQRGPAGRARASNDTDGGPLASPADGGVDGSTAAHAGVVAGRPHLARNLARTTRMWWELASGYWSLRGLGRSVTVFGSSRIDESHPDFEMARQVGWRLGRAGFDVVTGGGPGVMAAASKGAREAGARAVGCAIRVSRPQDPNDHLDLRVDFEHFFVRKLMMAEFAEAFIFLPGGYGTVDEVFEVATLIQTRKITRRPVIGIGQEFWSGVRRTVTETMLAAGAIDESEADIITIVDDAAAAVDLVVRATR